MPPIPNPFQAALCADTLASGGTLHIFDSGHMVSSELINRAGGLVALSALSFNLNVVNPVKSRPAQADETSLSFAYIEHVFETNQLRPGDVLVRRQRFGQDRQRGRTGPAGPRPRADRDRPDRPGLQLEAGLGAPLRQAPV